MSDRASETLAEAVLRGEPRTYDTISTYHNLQYFVYPSRRPQGYIRLPQIWANLRSVGRYKSALLCYALGCVVRNSSRLYLLVELHDLTSQKIEVIRIF
jgi:hypothetical protein